MTLQNRVRADGEIVAAPARGTLMGNRGGVFHRPDQTLKGRHWATRQWIACVLAFKGRRRTVMSPGLYTELFFLDEATALAAGHRPCFECRRADALLFAKAWAKAGRGTGRASAPEMDAVLHAERLMAGGAKRTYVAPLASLPTGTMLRHGGDIQVVADATGARLATWTIDGYRPTYASIPRDTDVEVLTPPSIVRVLAAGYVPGLHVSCPERRA